MPDPNLGGQPAAQVVAIRVQPRASRDQVLGERHGAIAIALKAPPVDGQANAALQRFLAERLGVARSRVRLLRGATGRSKWIAVDGLDAGAVKAQLLHHD